MMIQNPAIMTCVDGHVYISIGKPDGPRTVAYTIPLNSENGGVSALLDISEDDELLGIELPWLDTEIAHYTSGL